MGEPVITIRRTEPGDYEAVRQIFLGPSVIAGTLQMPFPSAEFWRKRLDNPPEGLVSLVACADGEIVGQRGLSTFSGQRRG
ncbi:MAG: GNAT family N-acetyltransferase, partial [Cyanobacteria bacterium P01_A01_bin.135]